mmetsp:Transcript_26679/g.48910  ORF Transcript_26679/g.48910 Transcript_26679/m.48910 type:complete len:243 (+) Transcript_26679:1125-1853(+)
MKIVRIVLCSTGLQHLTYQLILTVSSCVERYPVASWALSSRCKLVSVATSSELDISSELGSWPHTASQRLPIGRSRSQRNLGSLLRKRKRPRRRRTERGRCRNQSTSIRPPLRRRSLTSNQAFPNILAATPQPPRSRIAGELRRCFLLRKLEVEEEQVSAEAPLEAPWAQLTALPCCHRTWQRPHRCQSASQLITVLVQTSSCCTLTTCTGAGNLCACGRRCVVRTRDPWTSLQSSWTEILP